MLALLLLLLFWCCPSKRCSAITRAMQPGPPRQQQAEKHGHPMGIPTEVKNLRKFHFLQGETVSKNDQTGSFSIFPALNPWVQMESGSISSPLIQPKTTEETGRNMWPVQCNLPNLFTLRSQFVLDASASFTRSEGITKNLKAYTYL